MDRQNFGSDAPWESAVGYSRAVKMGRFVWVAGTTATDADGRVVGGDDPYAQADQALNNVERALLKAGASLSDVVRTRIFVTDIAHWEAIGRAHGERFRHVRPAATLVQVGALVDPDMLVEIEVDAVIGGTDA